MAWITEHRELDKRRVWHGLLNTGSWIGGVCGMDY